MSRKTIMTEASQEWATRPEDERFETIQDLKAAVYSRRERSRTITVEPRNMRVEVDDMQAQDLRVGLFDPEKGDAAWLTPTHWGFGQLSSYADAPAGYLRRLPTWLTGVNLQYGLERQPSGQEASVLVYSNGSDRMRAVNSTTYGRIWDSEVVDAVERANHNGRWKVPAASYTARNPKRATTLYASDRDVFIFLVDPDRGVEVDGETLFRGFFVWNSEVGKVSFGLRTFLYRTICDNRIVWGATEVQELRIRHTSGAPERFAREAVSYLERYADESAHDTVRAIQAAKSFELPKTEKDTGWEGWLRSRGFSKGLAEDAVRYANAEEGEARSLWDIVQGVTAYARSVPHTDERVKLETDAGRLLELVA